MQDARALEDRIGALEREIRRWRAAAVIALAVAIVLATTAAAGGGKKAEIQAERLVLLGKGKPAAVLKVVDEENAPPVLVFANGAGKVKATLSLEPDWHTTFELAPRDGPHDAIELFAGEAGTGMFVSDKEASGVAKIWAHQDETRIELATPNWIKGFTTAKPD